MISDDRVYAVLFAPLDRFAYTATGIYELTFEDDLAELPPFINLTNIPIPAKELFRGLESMR
ncbi:MAG: hypothetical protein ACXQS5_02710 [Candidatus Methanospirareceae archaeon]